MYESHVFILSFPRRWESTFSCIFVLLPLIEGVYRGSCMLLITIYFTMLRKVGEYIANMLNIRNSLYMLEILGDRGKYFLHTQLLCFFDSLT